MLNYLESWKKILELVAIKITRTRTILELKTNKKDIWHFWIEGCIWKEDSISLKKQKVKTEIIRMKIKFEK